MHILFTGGGACGKSSFAEQLLNQLPQPYYYIATMQAYGADGAAKVAKHRRTREGRPFITIEQPRHIDELDIPAGATVLFEDVTNLVANEMFAEEGFDFDIANRVLADFEALFSQAGNLLIVTNEVGCELFGYTPETRAYIETMGAVNAVIAQRCDAVYEFVAGRPIEVKAPARPIPELEAVFAREAYMGGAR